MALCVVGYVNEQSCDGCGQLFLSDVAWVGELVWVEGANARGGLGESRV